ncbi:MAG: hypothetical protein QG608_2201 [Actinomycetota bacterium]|nr:hypothetical protein [Actinomycetota bacterium]
MARAGIREGAGEEFFVPAGSRPEGGKDLARAAWAAARLLMEAAASPTASAAPVRGSGACGDAGGGRSSQGGECDAAAGGPGR